MASYFSLKIKDYDVIYEKNYFNPEIGILFSEYERVVEVSKGNKYQYVSTVKKLLERLSIIGITPEKTKKEFSIFKKDYIEKFTADSEYYGDKSLKSLSLKKWCESIKQIIESEIRYTRKNVREQSNPIFRYILENDDFLYGFPTDDIRKTLSLILSMFPKDEKVILDLSPLIYSGYYEKYTRFVDLSKNQIIDNKYYNENIIILAEGTYDIFVLKETLQLLYPDKFHFFSFLDFDNSKTPGGAGHLVNYIRALSGASVTDKMIAIFDNDSAAQDAIRVLKSENIPKNIRYTKYPDIPYLNKYPTIGPMGKQQMNINGRAASIEMYMGDDILKKAEEAFPVQWTGYLKSINSYQGGIIDKGKAQEAFRRKIKTCKRSENEKTKADWSGIKAIWNHIYDLCSDFYI
ncbi:HEPN/Toprim-associated domain-containing protein [Treponema pectinovorum]|uniref:HEPN/Toprim-associated domain-containing protein n=1 Tax=Treponema pectinovorum TaxID=164 RepID=UPI0011C90A86|nr:HEPN/Toprim-associated domain-containing protein [Treponema pectinovorum]